MSGYIEAPVDGEYTFTLKSDNGAFLRLHEAQLIDADFNYQARQRNLGDDSPQSGQASVSIV